MPFDPLDPYSPQEPTGYQEPEQPEQYVKIGKLELGPVGQHIVRTAKKWKVDPAVALAVAQQESGMVQDKTSPKGARGIMQLMPGTAKMYGVDPEDWQQNIEGGIRYLSDLIDKHDDPAKVLREYNSGNPDADNPETNAYLPSVQKLIAHFQEGMAGDQGAGGIPDLAAGGASPVKVTKSPAKLAKQQGINQRTIRLQGEFEEAKTAGDVAKARDVATQLQARGWEVGEAGGWPYVKPPVAQQGAYRRAQLDDINRQLAQLSAAAEKIGPSFFQDPHTSAVITALGRQKTELEREEKGMARTGAPEPLTYTPPARIRKPVGGKLGANVAAAIWGLPVGIEKMALAVERGMGITPTAGFPEHIAEREADIARMNEAGGTGKMATTQRALLNLGVNLPGMMGAAAVGKAAGKFLGIGGLTGEIGAFGVMGAAEAAGEPEPPSLAHIGANAALMGAPIPFIHAVGGRGRIARALTGFAAGYVPARISGASQEDAIIHGATFGGFSAFGKTRPRNAPSIMPEPNPLEKPPTVDAPTPLNLQGELGGPQVFSPNIRAAEGRVPPPTEIPFGNRVIPPEAAGPQGLIPQTQRPPLLTAIPGALPPGMAGAEPPAAAPTPTAARPPVSPVVAAITGTAVRPTELTVGDVVRHPEAYGKEPLTITKTVGATVFATKPDGTVVSWRRSSPIGKEMVKATGEVAPTAPEAVPSPVTGEIAKPTEAQTIAKHEQVYLVVKPDGTPYETNAAGKPITWKYKTGRSAFSAAERLGGRVVTPGGIEHELTPDGKWQPRVSSAPPAPTAPKVEAPKAPEPVRELTREEENDLDLKKRVAEALGLGMEAVGPEAFGIPPGGRPTTEALGSKQGPPPRVPTPTLKFAVEPREDGKFDVVDTTTGKKVALANGSILANQEALRRNLALGAPGPVPPALAAPTPAPGKWTLQRSTMGRWNVVNKTTGDIQVHDSLASAKLAKMKLNAAAPKGKVAPKPKAVEPKPEKSEAENAQLVADLRNALGLPPEEGKPAPRLVKTKPEPTVKEPVVGQVIRSTTPTPAQPKAPQGPTKKSLRERIAEGEMALRQRMSPATAEAAVPTPTAEAPKTEAPAVKGRDLSKLDTSEMTDAELQQEKFHPSPDRRADANAELAFRRDKEGGFISPDLLGVGKFGEWLKRRLKRAPETPLSSVSFEPTPKPLKAVDLRRLVELENQKSSFIPLTSEEKAEYDFLKSVAAKHEQVRDMHALPRVSSLQQRFETPLTRQEKINNALAKGRVNLKSANRIAQEEYGKSYDRLTLSEQRDVREQVIGEALSPPETLEEARYEAQVSELKRQRFEKPAIDIEATEVPRPKPGLRERLSNVEMAFRKAIGEANQEGFLGEGPKGDYRLRLEEISPEDLKKRSDADLMELGEELGYGPKAAKVFTILGPKGDEAGTLNLFLNDAGTSAHVGWTRIGLAHQGMSAANIRGLLRQLKQAIPTLREIEGERISGAKSKFMDEEFIEGKPSTRQRLDISSPPSLRQRIAQGEMKLRDFLSEKPSVGIALERQDQRRAEFEGRRAERRRLQTGEEGFASSDLLGADAIVKALSKFKTIKENKAREMAETAIKDVNERTRYGRRTEWTNKPTTIVAWSNAGRRWDAYAMTMPAGEVTVDSNEILVPAGRKVAQAIADNLPPHPLDKLSFENNLGAGKLPTLQFVDDLMTAKGLKDNVQDFGQVDAGPGRLRKALSDIEMKARGKLEGGEEGFFTPGALFPGVVTAVQNVQQMGQALVNHIPELKAVKGAKETWNSMRKLIDPALGDPLGKMMARGTEEHFAWKALENQRAVKNMTALSKVFSSVNLPTTSYHPEVQALVASGALAPKYAFATDFKYRMQKGLPQATKELDALAKEVRKSLDEKTQQIRSLGTGALEKFDINYFPQLHKNPTKASLFMEQQAKRPLAGTVGGGLKARTYEDVVEAAKAGLEPLYSNPFEDALLRITQANHYIAGTRIALEALDPGMGGRWTTERAHVPDGMSLVKDTIFQQFWPPQIPGEVRAGKKYLLPTPVANVINQDLAAGLTQFPIFRGMRALANSMNNASLGLSAFHASFIAQEAISTKGALALEKFSVGDYAGAQKVLAETPAAPYLYAKSGADLMKAAMNPGKDPYLDSMVDALIAGGYHFGIPREHATAFREQLSKNWRDAIMEAKLGDPSKLVFELPAQAIRIPFAAIEAASAPIMEFQVPRTKAGAAMELMRHELQKLGPNYTRDELRQVARKVIHSVDNRFGQLAYDNLHWNRALKDVMQLVIRAPGWNIGTIREVGGGAKDIAYSTAVMGARAIESGLGSLTPQQVKNLAAGDPRITHRMAYVASLVPTAAMLGIITQALLTYYHTGQAEGPRDARDLFMPRSGRRDENGREERFSVPSYTKDILEYMVDIKEQAVPWEVMGRKVGPFASTLHEQWANKDFRGTEITGSAMLTPWSSDFNPLKAAGERLENVGQHFLPFSFQNFLRERERELAETTTLGSIISNPAKAWEETSLVQVLPWAGMTRAPAMLTDTPAQRLLQHYISGQRKQEPTTKEDAERFQFMSRAASAIKQGKKEKVIPEIRERLKAGTLRENDEETIFERAEAEYPMQYQFRSLDSFDKVVKVFETANDEEKKLMLEDFLDKGDLELDKWASSPTKTKEIVDTINRLRRQVKQ